MEKSFICRKEGHVPIAAFRNVKRTHARVTSPQMSLSSCSRLGEGIVFIKDNSCMPLPQDFPVGQDMEEEDGDTNAQVYITLRLMCVYSTDKLLRLLLHF